MPPLENTKQESAPRLVFHSEQETALLRQNQPEEGLHQITSEARAHNSDNVTTVQSDLLRLWFFQY